MTETISDSKQIDKIQADYKKLPSKIWLKTIGFTLVFLFILVIGTIATFCSIALYKTNQFRIAAKLDWKELSNIITQTLERKPISKYDRKNILLLGTDELSNRENHPVFTDTMMLLSIDLNSGKIYTLAIPRDLWLDDYKTKINALYIYGKDRYPEKPELFPQTIVSGLTGVEIHHSVIMSLDQLSQIIDLIGGVNIEIQESFTDDQFPRTDADISSNNPEELYETISFEKGDEKMSGARALKYIRSRHAQGQEGNDLARSRRQQQVISALVSQLSNFNTLKNTSTLGQLYFFYQTNFNKYLDTIELASTIKTLIPQRNNIEFSAQSLSIYPEDKMGVLTHPATKDYDDQWVYIVRDELKLKEEIKNKLNLDSPVNE